MRADKALKLIDSLSDDLGQIRQRSMVSRKYDDVNAWLDTIEGLIVQMFDGYVHIGSRLVHRLNAISFYNEDDDESTAEEDWSRGLAESQALLKSMRYHIELIDEPTKLDVPDFHGEGADVSQNGHPNTNHVFIVHGHDEKMKFEVSSFLYQLNLHPIILSDETNGGFKSVMEKFEQHANTAGFAIVLLSPDDYGYAKRDGDSAKKPRARQNVILELGYFIGKLGRDNVIAFTKPDEYNMQIEQPSDIIGGIIERFDNWQERIRKELKKAGYQLS